MAHFASQNASFCLAKCVISECKMAHFENQNEKSHDFVQFFYRLKTIRLSKTIKNPCKKSG